MKKWFTILAIVMTSVVMGQQSFSTSFLGDVKKTTAGSWRLKYKKGIQGKSDMTDEQKSTAKEKAKSDYKKLISSNKLGLPVFGIQGLGNINQEALKTFNASGKISFYVRPVQWRNSALTIMASYNKNASNNDSVLFQKLIFPEIGNSSFTGTIDVTRFWKKGKDATVHALSPFFEFSYKEIKSDSSAKNQTLYFTSLNYTAGVKYIYGFRKKDENDNKFNNLSFFAIPYFTILNIPNEDTADYRALIIRNVTLDPISGTINDKIYTAGFKIGFQVNGLQLFADFRNVLNKPEKLPIRELRGFNANIGIVFSADALEFYK